jgi:PhnB protein
MSATGTLPVLPVRDVGRAIEHYVKILGFTEVMRVPGPDGELVTGQVQRAGNHVMFNRNPADADKRGGGVWLWIRIDGEDIDALHGALKKAGLTIREELGDRFWGDRSFAVEDAHGYVLAFNKKLAR